jgi:hypothetical protein
MTSEHGTDFAQMPDLLEFRPELTERNDKGEFDIYGCAKARREGMTSLAKHCPIRSGNLKTV